MKTNKKVPFLGFKVGDVVDFHSFDFADRPLCDVGE